MAFDTDFFIAGGGPAGLATALAARQLGFRAMVADAAHGPIDKCCGEGLLPDGAAALRELGVTIPSSTSRFQGIDFVDGAVTARGSFSSGSGFGLRRTVLHTLIYEAAVRAGVDCLFGTRVTGLSSSSSVTLDRTAIRARWIIGADGYNSPLRGWAGLGRPEIHGAAMRFGFRRHFEIAEAPSHVEVHWGEGFQVFVTPVCAKEVSVAVTTRDSSFRLHHALAKLPALRDRLGKPASRETGAVTGTMVVPSIVARNVTLVGDASGAVDSITGQGLNLAFREAQSLVRAAAVMGGLQQYARQHRSMMRVPRKIARALLLLADHPWMRKGVLRALAAQPWMFDRMLAVHAKACTLYGPTTNRRTI